MTCDNQVGVKNIMLTFRDCDTGEEYGPYSHEMADDTQPTYRLCPYENTVLPGGYVERSKSNNQIDMNVVRLKCIPLAFYQGCASVDATIEHFNGIVVSGVNGTGISTDLSDGHSVTLSLAFRELDTDELLPQGTCDANEAIPTLLAA